MTPSSAENLGGWHLSRLMPKRYQLGEADVSGPTERAGHAAARLELHGTASWDEQAEANQGWREWLCRRSTSLSKLPGLRVPPSLRRLDDRRHTADFTRGGAHRRKLAWRHDRRAG